ncbi:hypothetical protein DWB61_13715 [Ancylomarina euxinus]|uniref:Porin n=1 Tax=Ancylomarina euxinus TaxID=2283627 RepID=A0A425XY90_9BACT|nr:putative porin [Ancylomarina euxinus]MCZ4695855.1 putative porin [Ancylomarina euxinus]MUP16081.1 hypothetical protein [Ancylomarina euxinus]RRG19803.1 hypothetical protein DWB61_13715 [Ancylomarina euxinus]
MKQIFILIIFTFCLSLSLAAQTETKSLRLGSKGDRGLKPDGLKRDGEKSEMDSLGYNSVESHIKTWRLSDYGTRKFNLHVDTLLGNIHNFNPIYQRTIANSYLGNLGSPYQSLIFKDRVREESFMFFNTFEAYMNMPKEVLFFNTTTPFTSFFYETAGSKDRAENNLRVLHTQNINPFWNVGISFNLISSEGQYQNQKTRLYDFNLFSNYEKGRYGAHFILNQNRILVNENGGVNDDGQIRDTVIDPENVQVKLSETKNKLSNFNFAANQYYNLGKGKDLIIDGDTSQIYPVKLIHDSNFESDSREFKEGVVNKDFFKSTYLNNDKSADETTLKMLSNGFHIVFNENQNKKLSFGARLGLLNQFSTYNLRRPVGENLYSQKDKNIHNTKLMTSIFRQTGKDWNWKFSGSYVFEGYNQNDYQLDGDLVYQFGDSINRQSLEITSQIKSNTPDFLMTEYHGNHQQWSLNLDKSKELSLGLEYQVNKYGFKIGGQINNLENYTYFGYDTILSQTSKSIQVATAYIEKDFRLGKFTLSQKIVGQKSSNEKILPLPDLSVYSNNYYSNTFFNGALDIQAGFSVYYNTSFYAPNYMPSTGQFFLQNEQELGDYPKVDLYFNFRIKRTRIFIMYEHLNAKMGSQNYFSSLHYPINPGMLKYGLRWTFYD